MNFKTQKKKKRGLPDSVDRALLKRPEEKEDEQERREEERILDQMKKNPRMANYLSTLPEASSNSKSQLPLGKPSTFGVFSFDRENWNGDEENVEENSADLAQRRENVIGRISREIIRGNISEKWNL
jgi:hypothetical protein